MSAETTMVRLESALLSAEVGKLLPRKNKIKKNMTTFQNSTSLWYIINVYAPFLTRDNLGSLMNKVRHPTRAITRTYVHKKVTAKGAPRYEAKVVVPTTHEEHVCTKKSLRDAIKCARKKSQIGH